MTLELLNHFIVASTVKQLDEIVNKNRFILNLFQFLKSECSPTTAQVLWMLSNIALDGKKQRDFLIKKGVLNIVAKVFYSCLTIIIIFNVIERR